MPTNCVWLDNVDQTVQENFLSRQFGRYGQVTHGIIDRIKGKALVYFTNAEQAQYALVEMRNRILNNKKIMVSLISCFFCNKSNFMLFADSVFTREIECWKDVLLSSRDLSSLYSVS